MTDAARRPATRKPPPRARPAAIYSGALALFVAAAGGIAAQIATGHDPALGVAREHASVPAVTVKHIKKTTVITKVVHDPPATGSAGNTYSPATAAPAQPSYQAPAPQRAPVQQQASAPAPAPAPAAAPAQPTTRSS